MGNGEVWEARGGRGVWEAGRGKCAGVFCCQQSGVQDGIRRGGVEEEEWCDRQMWEVHRGVRQVGIGCGRRQAEKGGRCTCASYCQQEVFRMVKGSKRDVGGTREGHPIVSKRCSGW